MIGINYPTHPALEKAILACSDAARDMEMLEYRLTAGVPVTEAWERKVTERWEASLRLLTDSARKAGKNTQKRSPSGMSLLYQETT